MAWTPNIVLKAGPTHSRLTGSGSIGSHSTQNAGSTIADTVAKIRIQHLAEAGFRAYASPEDLHIQDGQINRADGSLVITVAQMLQDMGADATGALAAMTIAIADALDQIEAELSNLPCMA